MGNCYSIDHIAEDHTHTEILVTLRNHYRSTAFERSVIDFGGGGGGERLKHVLPDPNPRPKLPQWLENSVRMIVF